MKNIFHKLPGLLFTAVYIYLALPVIMFFLFWLKLPVGVPMAFLVLLGVFICYREHDFASVGFLPVSALKKGKMAAIFLIVTFWVILSGIGGYVWQNSDHDVRNEIFNVMVENPWPVYSNTPEHTPLVYYIGFWLPAAAVGKIFGMQAGNLFQVIWTIVGILLCYALICLKRKKISLWPLILFICFSGLDVIGTMLAQTDTLDLFGTAHLEWWASQFQFSSMTTQLFWVFNQAVPAWLACTFLFLYERPKNMLFTLSLLPLVSTFPFVGMIPFVVYFLISRSKWNSSYTSPRHLVVDIRHNLISIQNVIIPLAVCGIIGMYLLGNQSVSGTVSLLYTGNGAFRGGVMLVCVGIILVLAFLMVQLWRHGKDWLLKALGILALSVLFLYLLAAFDAMGWWFATFLWTHLTVFYFLEVGVFLVVLYPFIREKKLFWLNAICLYLIPLMRVGYGFDFCMRASIPGLLLILLWCIETFDRFEAKTGMRAMTTIISLDNTTISSLQDMRSSESQAMDGSSQQGMRGSESQAMDGSSQQGMRSSESQAMDGSSQQGMRGSESQTMGGSSLQGAHGDSSQAMDVASKQEKVNTWNDKLRICILSILLLLGAATPFHEVKRTYMNTFSYYELQTISEEKLYQGSNVCGNPDSFFWKYLAR